MKKYFFGFTAAFLPFSLVVDYSIHGDVLGIVGTYADGLNVVKFSAFGFSDLPGPLRGRPFAEL